MNDFTPTLPDIGAAFRAKLAEVVGKDAYIVPQNQDANPDLKQILVINALNPSSTTTEEMGGRSGLAESRGMFSINLSYPKNNNPLFNSAWALAGKLAAAFRQLDLKAGSDDCFVYTEECSVTNVGDSFDENRKSLLVSVAWRAWTGGK